MGSACVLYVEDNFDNRLLIKRVLEAEGYRILEADSGRSGLDLALNHHPDIILIDINLPDIDGYEVTDRLRKAEQIGQKVPIVAITANALVGDRQKAISAGCDGYIPKPVDIDALPAQIEYFLQSKSFT